MVEGPGCTNNGCKARSHTGKCVATATGQAATKIAESICGMFLATVWTLGKELWLIFQDSLTSATREIAIRVHFGMSGSLLVNGARPRFGGKDLSLSIRYEQGGNIDIFGAAVEMETSVAKVRAKCERLHVQDVCADEGIYSANACMAAMASKPSMLVADAVLDQAILPGAGNIIKNEALHRARVLPSRRVESLSDAEIKCIVGEVRIFSMQWLRSGRAPFSLIYNKTSCGECGGVVKLQKVGEGGLPRATFWCPRCCSGQNQHGQDANRRSQALVRSQSSPVVNASHNANNVESMILYGDETFDVMARKSAASRKRESRKDHNGGGERRIKRHCATPQSANSNSTPLGRANGPSPMQTVQTSTSSQFSELAPPTSCARHGRGSLVLKRVRKQGANNSRLFFACRAAGCSYFEWADKHLPRCCCPSQPTAALRVSKKESSGGRWFFACRAEVAGKRCNFFAWASPLQLQPLQGLLNPLT